MTVTTLASGSSGNCTLVSQGDTHILVDAGISCRRINSALKTLGLTAGDLSGICITHEHSDHIAGLATLTKNYRVPVYATPGTGRQLCYRVAFLEDLLTTFTPGQALEIGGLTVETFPTLHDTAQPCGYALSNGSRKAAVVTDLGAVTEEVRRGIRGADLLVVEANHDVEQLLSGPYPYYLKERILGDRGHLSNEAGAALAREGVDAGAHTIVLAHLSHENNTPAMARNAAEAALAGRNVTLTVAPRNEMGVPLPC